MALTEERVSTFRTNDQDTSGLAVSPQAAEWTVTATSAAADPAAVSQAAVTGKAHYITAIHASFSEAHVDLLIFDAGGELLVVREDVGRHNAVDKAIGYAMLEERLPLDAKVLIVSGRTSFEILQKALVARIPIVAGVSAASSLAVEFAAQSNMTLIGFLRESKMNVYTGAERVIGT